MPIEDREIAVGTVLTARHKKYERTCEVVQTDGGLRYRLDDGSAHKSPSSAGKAVTGGACNGWVFWSVQGTEPAPRASKPSAKRPEVKVPAKASKKAKKTSKSKKPAKAQSAKSRGESYGCGACGEMFETMKAATEHALTHSSAD